MGNRQFDWGETNLKRMTEAKSKWLALPMDDEKPKRRVRYSGTHPKAFKEKYNVSSKNGFFKSLRKKKIIGFLQENAILLF